MISKIITFFKDLFSKLFGNKKETPEYIEVHLPKNPIPGKENIISKNARPSGGVDQG